MKKDIHPKYYPKATITCACGNVMTIGSTKEKMSTEICSACHPYYTGKAKVMDAAGRVDRFKTRLARTAQLQTSKTKVKKSKAKK